MAINKLGTENLAGILSGKSSNPQEIEEKTDNYTLVFTDKDRLVTMNSAGDRTITIPADATTAFLTGTKIDIANIGAGTLTIAGASGVTLNGVPTILAQNQSAQITKLGDDNWIVRGYASFPQPRYTFTASGGETSISGLDDNSKTLSYVLDMEKVFLNGVLLVQGTDYTATNGTSIDSLSALTTNDVVQVFSL